MHPRVRFWYEKFRSQGLDYEEAELMATLKYEIEKDRSLIDWLKQEGISGFKDWAMTNCPTLYTICSNVWGAIKRFFGF